MIQIRDIVNGSMLELKSGILAGMIQRDKNATGRTSRSIEVVTTGGEGFTQGNLIANDNWRTVGSGSPPRTLANIQDLQEWQRARKVNINVYFLQRLIYAQGSKDFRERNRNVFIEEIDQWEKYSMRKVEQKGGDYLMDRTEQIVLQSGLK